MSISEEKQEQFEISDGLLVCYKGDDEIVRIPEGVNEINEQSFELKRSQLKAIYCPKSLRVISSKSFSFCTNLRKIEFEEGIEEIGEQVFLACDNLITLEIPKSIKKIDLPDNLLGIDWITLTVSDFIEVNSRAYYLPYELVDGRFLSEKPQKNSLSQIAYIKFATLALESPMPLRIKEILSIVITKFHTNLSDNDRQPFWDFMNTHTELLDNQQVQAYCNKYNLGEMYLDMKLLNQKEKNANIQLSNPIITSQMWQAESSREKANIVAIAIQLNIKAERCMMEQILYLIQDIFELDIHYQSNTFYELTKANKLKENQITNELIDIRIIIEEGRNYSSSNTISPNSQHLEKVNELFPKVKMRGCIRENARVNYPLISNAIGELSFGPVQYSLGDDWCFNSDAPPEPPWWNDDNARPIDAKPVVRKYYKKTFNRDDLFCTTNRIADDNNINKRSEEGLTQLMQACQDANLDPIETLLQKGADINNIMSTSGYSTMKYAIDSHSLQVVEMLIRAGANVERWVDADDVGSTQTTPLMAAIRRDLKDIVILLIRSGANIEATDSQYKNVFWHALSVGNHEIVELLIAEGVNMFSKNPLGEFIITQAMGGYPSLEIIEMLLKNGAASVINYSNKHTELPLHLAIKSGRVNLVKLLLGYGADPSIATAFPFYSKKWFNALEFAQSETIKNKDEILSMLSCNPKEE